MLGAIVLLLAWPCRAPAADRTERELHRSFAEKVHPFLETYCFGCHGQEKQKGKLDLSSYSTVEAVASDYRRWDLVLEKLKGRSGGLIPTIMITGNEGSRHRAYAEMLGVRDYIRKPFAMEKLVRSVEKILDSKVSGSSMDNT